MVDEKPIVKHGARIMRPWEWFAIRDRLKPGTQMICDVSLNTEMRSTELWFFIQHPEWFHESRRAIELPKEAILKKRCTLDERTVLLSIEGVKSVKTLFDASKKARVEHDRSNLRKELREAAVEANLVDTGISPKMFRKTMISWLMATLSEKEPYILMSAGHGKDVQQRHYLAAGFERRDIEDMRKFLRGWGEA
jgi:integrase